ncbi:MAG TPA: 1-acyl-sn-glycerol-3-phosphate acyltransferase, partial [Candidatus Limnocylindrales bacterium]|nr:1-acyl-sn-glycerol-3-phosphate acyltransferase [Candidatus Limnocylindrales bacterium]
SLAEAKLRGTAVATAPAAVAASGDLGELIASISGKRVALKPGDHLENDLNLSSLERVELMAAIENRYQIDLNDSEFSAVNTVNDLERLLKHTAPEQEIKKDYPYSRWGLSWPIRLLRTLAFHLVTRPYIWVMARPKIIGRERVNDFQGPALIISNHITQNDIGFLMAALPFRLRNRLAVAMQGEMLKDMRYPPKETFFFKRWWMPVRYALIVTFFNVFSLPQRARYRESFRFAGEMADKGYNVVIFPEGKRTETGDMNPFRSGIGLLAKDLDLPVIPMRIDGLFPFKAAKKHYAPPGAIQVRIGKPVKFDPHADPEEIALELERKVKAL